MAEYSHIIFFCLQSCKQLNYSPSCESTLYQILKELKPFQRHSLAGLDDITTDDMTGFLILKKAASLHWNQKGVLDSLEQGERYLKMQCSIHCED